MAESSRERVRKALRFESPQQLPRDVWILPWALANYPEETAELQKRYPNDIEGLTTYRPAATADTEQAPDIYRPSSRMQGDPYAAGTFVDDWGCTFTNIHPGVIGEVREPLLEEIEDWKTVQPPHETLPEDKDAARNIVNRACASTDRFVKGGCLPRPWERLQFLRGTENAMLDVMMPEEGARDLLRVIHEYYMMELEFWVTTDVDGIWFMDDWGSQTQLLIPPPVWRDLFKPLYRDYCDIIHGAGKFTMMHSDGYIAEIYTDLVEVGVDCLNSQIFCMDMAQLAAVAKGKLTFWGEIDRQHVLPATDPQKGRDAVRKVARHLYDPRGGIIAQFELGPASHMPTAMAILDEWEKVHAEATAG